MAAMTARCGAVAGVPFERHQQTFALIRSAMVEVCSSGDVHHQRSICSSAAEMQLLAAAAVPCNAALIANQAA
jgi:hypothetical protein